MSSGFANEGIRMTHLTSAGAVDTNWNVLGSGAPLSFGTPDPDSDEKPQMVRTSLGNVFVAFLSSVEPFIKAYLVDADGVLNTSFSGVDGIQMSNLGNTGMIYNFVAVSDGNSGLITLYRFEGGDPDYTNYLEATHVNSTGIHNWGTFTYNAGVLESLTGVIVRTDSINVLNAISDGSNGVIAAWTDDEYNTSANVYAQKLNSSGAELWGVDGLTISNEGTLTPQSLHSLATDGAGGAILAYLTPTTVRGQRILSTGTLDWGTGIQLGTATTTNDFASAAPGSGVIAWAGDSNIYAQKLDSDTGGGCTGGGTGSQQEQCATQEITCTVGTLTFNHTPIAINFDNKVASGNTQQSYDALTNDEQVLTVPNLLAIRDTRSGNNTNCPLSLKGFIVQATATNLVNENGTSPDIPKGNMNIITSNELSIPDCIRADGEEACYGSSEDTGNLYDVEAAVLYDDYFRIATQQYLKFNQPDPYLWAAENDPSSTAAHPQGDAAAPTPLLNALSGTVDLLSTLTSHNQTIFTGVAIKAEIPAGQDPGTYTGTITYTLAAQ
jgi:hypothetical protein